MCIHWTEWHWSHLCSAWYSGRANKAWQAGIPWGFSRSPAGDQQVPSDTLVRFLLWAPQSHHTSLQGPSSALAIGWMFFWAPLPMETVMAKTIHCAHVTWPSKLRIDGMHLGQVLIGSEIAMCTCSLSSSMQINYRTWHVTMYGTYVCIEHMYVYVYENLSFGLLGESGQTWLLLHTCAWKRTRQRPLPQVSWSKSRLTMLYRNGHFAVKKHPFMSIHNG